MAQDYARRHEATKVSNGGLPGWVWFLTGLATGVFGSFLVYLWRDVPADPAAEAIAGKPATEISSPRVEQMEWDFYDIFPKTEVPVVEEYAEDGSKVRVEEPSAYVLQAGSFRNPEDADRLRAELILMGMEVFTREIDKDGVKWHRVLVGPIDSKVEMDRLRRQLAEADIASISLKVTP